MFSVKGRCKYLLFFFVTFLSKIRIRIHNKLIHEIMILKGTFTSKWDFGSTVITSAAVLDTETGYVEAHSVDVGDMELFNLDDEFFTDDEGNEYPICDECHEYILKTVCMNPDCENHL